MEIQELELKNFGKFTDEKIQLQDGIQLFYGENEAGKSTIHTFIKSMLFGMERGRGRASVNDTSADMSRGKIGILCRSDDICLRK
ncbi:MAG: AAA family ATPase [Lachnoclostridium sp.]